jgi:ribonuclease HI
VHRQRGRGGSSAVQEREREEIGATIPRPRKRTYRIRGEAELAGAAIAAKMLNTERSGRYMVSLENQAAIQTTRREKAIPGQYLVNVVHMQIHGVVEFQVGVRVVMRWVPGHEGVEGNEQADEEAKRVAKGETSHEWDIPIECWGVLPISRVAETQRHNTELNREARAIFAKSPRAPFALKIYPTMPSAAFSKITRNMPGRHTSLLIQLRTGHIALNKYLHKIGKADLPLCPECHNTSKTVHHYLFRCPAFSEQRKRLEKRLKRGANSVRTLLGGHKAMKHLFRHIHDTKRFKESHGDVLLLMWKDKGNKRWGGNRTGGMDTRKNTHPAHTGTDILGARPTEYKQR